MDPGRFHVRGYNAELESRQRKKFQRQMPIVEKEFLEILSRNEPPTFFIDNQPIRQRVEQIRRQLFASSEKATTPARKVGQTPSRNVSRAKENFDFSLKLIESDLFLIERRLSPRDIFISN